MIGGEPIGEPIADQPLAVEIRLEEVHRRIADEPGDEPVVRRVVTLQWRADLLEDTVVEDGDPVAHRHRLGLVVGDVDRRHVEVFLEALKLGPHRRPDLGIEVRQRLVHQERLGIANDGPTEGDTLLLAIREIRGLRSTTSR